MDWIVDTRDDAALAAFAGDVRRHLTALAAVSSGVEEAADRVGDALRDARRGSTWVELAWPDGRATVRLRPVEGGGWRLGTAGAVPVQQAGRLPATAEPVATVPLGLERASSRAYDAGPPPVERADVDAHRDGVAAVAAGMVAVREAHPVADPDQTSAMAGALLGEVAAERAAPAPDSLGDAVRLFVDSHRALGSDAEVVGSPSEDRAEVAVSRCPLGPGVVGHPSACPVTTALAGRLASMARGEASVLLERSIARGDDQCHLLVAAGPAPPRSGAEAFVWPPVTSGASTAPHLELSLLLPSESASVPVVRRLATQALRTFGVAEDDVHDVQLAITEACANVIDHVSDVDTYEVRVELAADRCALTVVDQGRGFDAAAVPQDVAVTAEDGRGLALMRALVDRVAFRSEPRAGAVVHMVKALRYDDGHPLRHG